MILEEMLFKSFLDMVSVVGYIIAFLTYGYLIYDHFKKVIDLCGGVQEFYEDVGNLIYNYYKKEKLRKLYEGDKTRILEELFSSEMMHIRYQGRFEQSHQNFAKYLGLIEYTYSKKKYFLSSSWKAGTISPYINEAGMFHKFYCEPVSNSKDLKIERRKDFYDTKKREHHLEEKDIKMITQFIGSLKRYWERNYNKHNLFWRKLKSPNLEYGDLESKKELKFPFKKPEAKNIFETRKIIVKYLLIGGLMIFLSVPIFSMINSFLDLISPAVVDFWSNYLDILPALFIILIWLGGIGYILGDIDSKWGTKKDIEDFNVDEEMKSLEESESFMELSSILRKLLENRNKITKERSKAREAMKDAQEKCEDGNSTLNDVKEVIQKYASFFS